jgi:hypothetical protein
MPDALDLLVNRLTASAGQLEQPSVHEGEDLGLTGAHRAASRDSSVTWMPPHQW